MLTTDIPPSQTIYVRNINEKIKKEELKRSLYALFSQYGRILDIVALKTPKLRGQAWVVFSEVPAASNAVRQMQNFQFYEKPLRIQYAKAKSDCIAKAEGTYDKKKKQEEKAERKRRAEEPPAATANGSRADTNGGPPVASRQGKPSAQESAAEPNNILFIQNLPYETNSMMLELLFKQYPGFREVRMVEAKPEEIIFSILDFLEFDPQSKKSFSATCKSFYSIESRHRKSLKLLHSDFTARAVKRYRHIHRVDFTHCAKLDDGALSSFASAYSGTLKSADLSKSRFFTHVGLSSLAVKCGGLVELDLSNATELRDSGAAAVAEARNLEKLYMARCRLVSDIGIGCIAVGCKKLKLICLRWCVRVTDLGVGLIANKCRDLRALDLSYLPITDKGLSPVLQLQNLKELTLVGCPGIDDDSLKNMKQGSKSLEVLDISYCSNISFNGLVSLINDAKLLHQLNLAYCFSVTSDLAKCFYKMSELQIIKLDGCRVSFALLKSIADDCENLKELSCFKCNGVTDEGLSYIARKHKQLRKLDITCCQEITDASINIITNSCSYLTSLRMENCSMVSKEAFVLIGNRCQSLEDVDFTETEIDDEGLEAISRCSKLKSLKLGLCVHITDHGLSRVGGHCQNLRDLDLYRCMAITDVGIAAIAYGCPLLEMINMAYCDKIGDDSLTSLANCPRLKTLEIRGCPSISSVGLSAVAMGCKQLTVVDIKKCCITDAGLISLAQHSQYLKQINISYCPVTDAGVLALASICRLQNMTILNVTQLTRDGLIAALLACRGLMKLKLHTSFKSRIPEAILSQIEERGCILHWRNKVFQSPFRHLILSKEREREARVVFQTMRDLDVLDDDYRSSCKLQVHRSRRKHVDRASDDPGTVMTKYEGEAR
ncbi:RNI-like superfamily protein [Perilla frutescens var. hirtella]|nr:RNI-like superfamily protein [Perilla frutescens var. hirtella]